MSRYIVLFAGGTIAWSMKKQSMIALSMAKAEYITAMHTTKQVLWHQTLCKELSIPQPAMSIILCDNQATIVIAHDLEFHVHTKHIDIAYHSLCDLVESGTLNIVYVPSSKNLADLFMKGLARLLHWELANGLSVMLE